MNKLLVVKGVGADIGSLCNDPNYPANVKEYGIVFEHCCTCALGKGALSRTQIYSLGFAMLHSCFCAAVIEATQKRQDHQTIPMYKNYAWFALRIVQCLWLNHLIRIE